MKDMTFSYAPNTPPVLKSLSLLIHPGEKVCMFSPILLLLLQLQLVVQLPLFSSPSPLSSYFPHLFPPSLPPSLHSSFLTSSLLPSLPSSLTPSLLLPPSLPPPSHPSFFPPSPLLQRWVWLEGQALESHRWSMLCSDWLNPRDSSASMAYAPVTLDCTNLEEAWLSSHRCDCVEDHVCTTVHAIMTDTLQCL